FEMKSDASSSANNIPKVINWPNTPQRSTNVAVRNPPTKPWNLNPVVLSGFSGSGMATEIGLRKKLKSGGAKTSIAVNRTPRHKYAVLVISWPWSGSPVKLNNAVSAPPITVRLAAQLWLKSQVGVPIGVLSVLKVLSPHFH